MLLHLLQRSFQSFDCRCWRRILYPQILQACPLKAIPVVDVLGKQHAHELPLQMIVRWTLLLPAAIWHARTVLLLFRCPPAFNVLLKRKESGSTVLLVFMEKWYLKRRHLIDDPSLSSYSRQWHQSGLEPGLHWLTWVWRYTGPKLEDSISSILLLCDITCGPGFCALQEQAADASLEQEGSGLLVANISTTH